MSRRKQAAFPGGHGARFRACVERMSARPDVRSPESVCGAIGRRKYGAKGMAALAASGRRASRSNPDELGIRFVLGIRGSGAARTSEVQSVLFAKSVWTIAQARAWLERQGFRSADLDEGGERARFYHFRQRDPDAYQSFAVLVPGQAKNNPAGAAAEAYEEFHGRPATGQVEISAQVHEHRYLAEIGPLIRLVVLTDDPGQVVELKKFEGALLTMNEQRTQLFIDGGDQSVDLAEFGIEEPYHETEVLGLVDLLAYHTTKDHLGAEGGTAVYEHRFGAEGGELPTLIYRVRDQLLEFAGGDYSIPREGIKG